MKYIKQTAGILLGVILAASIVSCTITDTEELTPVKTRNGFITQAGAFSVITPQSTGTAVYCLNPDEGITELTYQDQSWKTEQILTESFIQHMGVWGDDLLCGITEGEGLAWYVYDTETDAKVPPAILETGTAAEVLEDVSGICIIDNGLYVMHSYWAGISRIDLTTGDYVTFDAEIWNRQVSCSADEHSFYVSTPTQMEVFDLVSGKKTVYDWSEYEHWLEGAKISSTYLTENGRMYFHISREDAMVPEEIKRAVWYVDTNGDLSQPVSLTSLGDLHAYSVTRLCGEYAGTLVLSDGTTLYAYDTENDKITALCAFPQNGVTCAGAYVLTGTADGMEVIAEIPASVT